MNLAIRVREDLNSIIQKLNSGRNEVTLEIAQDWNLEKEVQNYLRKTDN